MQQWKKVVHSDRTLWFMQSDRAAEITGLFDFTSGTKEAFDGFTNQQTGKFGMLQNNP